MIAVDNRIHQLEEQLGAIGSNYLGSLEDQVASLDAVLARFGSELEQIPEREVQFARLERQTTMLAELFAAEGSDWAWWYGDDRRACPPHPPSCQAPCWPGPRTPQHSASPSQT